MKNNIFYKIKENFYKYSNLNEYTSPDCIDISIYNKNKLTLEGKYEIIKYSEINITLKTKQFIIAVFGENLFISTMKKNFLSIEGNIIKIEYIDL